LLSRLANFHFHKDDLAELTTSNALTPNWTYPFFFPRFMKAEKVQVRNRKKDHSREDAKYAKFER